MVKVRGDELKKTLPVRCVARDVASRVARGGTTRMDALGRDYRDQSANAATDEMKWFLRTRAVHHR